MSGANKLRITLDQLRMAAKQGSRYQNPCFDKIERLLDAMERTGTYNIQPLYKYVKEAEECYQQADIEEKKKGKASTTYFLTQYLDRKKFKKEGRR
ncbi:expressed unknown protein [Seminavis robusta]|uniref:Uncharacterized protein n=1 Tax=Seminavis robusta TaxID=568900 RepID=A0A9N8H876_9STRA|nr:expressed unknown protein [Seminavis robusta]|eukprot:Sro229_g093040.1 n/a (96) ;mRNA; r:48530-48937